MKTVVKVINGVEEFLNNIFVVFSKGFFFYFSLLAGLLHKVFPLSIFEKMKLFFIKKQNDAAAFLLIVVVFLLSINIYIRFNSGNNTIVHVSKDSANSPVESKVAKLDETELNLYKRYSKLDINDLSIKELKKINKEIVAWIAVDGTNINYPIVKALDNNFYLNHDINGNLKFSGWTFMDYRNDSNLRDNNTIFYGHNLANKTAFGSLENLFKKDWLESSNHYVIVLSETGKSIYEIFSVYTTEPEVYYLQNTFDDQDSFYEFEKSLKERSIYDFNVDIEKYDSIITLSTCTTDNQKRSVVHAKLVRK